jgi:hypothetical protein
MKKTALNLTAIILFIILYSCSSSSTTETPIEENNATPTLYLPLKSNNYWTYRVENQASNNTPSSYNTPASTLRDSLYVGNDTLISAVSFKKMKTRYAPNGFFSSELKNNGMRIDGSRLKISGKLSSSLIPGLPAIDIAIADFTILKDNEVAGTLLSTTSGVINQTVSSYPLTIDYTLKSIAGGNLASYTSNGITYTNVKKSKLILNLTIKTLYSGLTVVLLNAQDVVTSTQYFVQNKGLIYDNRVLNYQLNTAIPAAFLANLPIPSSANQVQEEFIDTYNVSN